MPLGYILILRKVQAVEKGFKKLEKELAA